MPFRHYGTSDWFRLLRTGRAKRFVNHSRASFVRASVTRDVWNGYFKFCFERNPFDKAISRYHWSTREPRPGISDYLESAPTGLLSNWSICTIDGRMAVDFVGRYERLDHDPSVVARKIGLCRDVQVSPRFVVFGPIGKAVSSSIRISKRREDPVKNMQVTRADGPSPGQPPLNHAPVDVAPQFRRLAGIHEK